MTSASRPSADLPIPDAAWRAAEDAVENVCRETGTRVRGKGAIPTIVYASAPLVVAQFLRDLAAVHDRVSGGLLAELADGLDPQTDEDGASQ